MPVERPDRISVRDFLVPDKALTSTGAFDNPLLIHSLRRAKRWPRMILLGLLEAVLIAAFFLLLFTADAQFYWFSRWIPELMRDALRMVGISLPYGGFIRSLSTLAVSSRALTEFEQGYSEFIFAAGSFLPLLLLRYHLLINDQSRHVKTLSRQQLQQLLLTPLTGADYFLHHFLFFCRRHRVIFGFFAIGVFCAVFGEVDFDYLTVTMLFFNVILFTWLAAAAQYVLEWRIFAGGRRSPMFQAIVSWLFSIALAVFCLALSTSILLLTIYFVMESFVLFLLFLVFATPLVFLALAVLVHAFGAATYQDALELLWRRLARDDPDREAARQRQPGIWALCFPFRRIALSPAEQEVVEQYKKMAPQKKTAIWRLALIGCLGFIIGLELFGLLIAPAYYFPMLTKHLPLHASPWLLLIVCFPACIAGLKLARAESEGIQLTLRILFSLYGRKIARLSILAALVLYFWNTAFLFKALAQPEYMQWNLSQQQFGGPSLFLSFEEMMAIDRLAAVGYDDYLRQYAQYANVLRQRQLYAPGINPQQTLQFDPRQQENEYLPQVGMMILITQADNLLLDYFANVALAYFMLALMIRFGKRFSPKNHQRPRKRILLMTGALGGFLNCHLLRSQQWGFLGPNMAGGSFFWLRWGGGVMAQLFLIAAVLVAVSSIIRVLLSSSAISIEPAGDQPTGLEPGDSAQAQGRVEP